MSKWPQMMTFVRARYCTYAWDKDYNRDFFLLGLFLIFPSEGREGGKLLFYDTKKRIRKPLMR